ncbi:MAG: amidase family protein, partial [Ilumatobacteraceae bacterium]
MSLVTEIVADIRSGATTASAVLEAHLARIVRGEKEIHAFNLVTTENARATASRIDADIAGGKDCGKLAGVPVA